jgi:probable O-glycosylation ligase (exosortase A-associated)
MLRQLLFLAMMGMATYGVFVSAFGALLAYIWFALFRPQEFTWYDITSLKLSLVLGVMLVVRSLMEGKFPNLSHRISIIMVCFLLTGLLAQVGAFNPAVGWNWIDYFARLSLVSLLMVTLTDSVNRFRYAILVIALSLGYYTCKAGLASLLGGGMRFGVGLGGAFIDNNGYALAAVMLLPFFYALSVTVPEHWRFRKPIVWGLRMAIPLTMFAAVSTFSRGGLLALAAAGFVFIMLFVKRRALSLAMVAVVLAVALPFVPLPEGYTERMTTIVTYQEVGEESATSRLHFWEVAWDMAVDRPLGVGMRNFDYAYDSYDFLNGRFGKGRAVHNSHLQVLAEQGFAGFFLWVGAFVTAFSLCMRMRRIGRGALGGTPDGEFIFAMSGALAVSMTAFIVGGTFIALALNDLTWMTFALVAALDRVAAHLVAVKEGKVAADGRTLPIRRRTMTQPQGKQT